MAVAVNMTNVPTTHIGAVVKQLLPMYRANLETLERCPAVMLWGQPGVGKSDGIHQLCDMLGKSSGRPVHMYDMRLLLFGPIDLRGIPVPNAAHTEAVWLRPGILPPAEDHPDYDAGAIYVVFLDELTAAPASVQAAAYQLILNKAIGEHKLPPNTLVVAAGNRLSDKSVANKMPMALSNRMLHFQVEVDYDAWKEWAIPAGVHQWVLAYLNSSNGGKLNLFDPTSDSVAFPTPRSWMFVSDILSGFNNNLRDAAQLVAAAVGLGVGHEFNKFIEVAHEMPSLEGILTGVETKVPTKPDILYAVTGSLVAGADKYKPVQLGHILKYALKMPEEFAVLLIKDMLKVPKAAGIIVRLPGWLEFASKFKDLISID